jgi:hypothetical protein
MLFPAHLHKNRDESHPFHRRGLSSLSALVDRAAKPGFADYACSTCVGPEVSALAAPALLEAPPSVAGRLKM